MKNWKAVTHRVPYLFKGSSHLKTDLIDSCDGISWALLRPPGVLLHLKVVNGHFGTSSNYVPADNRVAYRPEGGKDMMMVMYTIQYLVFLERQ